MRLVRLLRKAPTVTQGIFSKHRGVRHSSNGNRGMDASVFKSVFQPIDSRHPAASTVRDGRYLWRWDWHLRNFIYALMPPAAAYAYILAIQWYMGDKVENFEKMMNQKQVEEGGPLEEVTNRAKSLEERVAAMERYVEKLEKERDEAKRQAEVSQVTETIRQQQDEVRQQVKTSKDEVRQQVETSKDEASTQQ